LAALSLHILGLTFKIIATGTPPRRGFSWNCVVYTVALYGVWPRPNPSVYETNFY
jgi:hypothetical protein